MASPTDDVVMPYQVGFPFWSRSVNSGSGDRRFRVSPPADNYTTQSTKIASTIPCEMGTDEWHY